MTSEIRFVPVRQIAMQRPSVPVVSLPISDRLNRRLLHEGVRTAEYRIKRSLPSNAALHL